MAVCVRKKLLAVLLVASPLFARATTNINECGLVLSISSTVQLVRDLNAVEPTCQLNAVSAIPSPFVNRISRLPWLAMDKLTARDPSRNAAFFSLLPKRAIRYSGRPSYFDGRAAYKQAIVGGPHVSRSLSQGKTTIVARSKLRVTWLKPIDAKSQEETTEYFECVDAAVSVSESVVLLNWCAKRETGEVRAMADAVSSLNIEPR